MEKKAYVLAYVGSISSILINILGVFVGYSYYLDQPSKIAEASLILASIWIFVNILILILILKLNLKKYSSILVLIFTVLLALVLPGVLNYGLKLIYLPKYAPSNLYSIAYYILNESLNYFMLYLVLFAGILFIINNNIHKEK